MSAIFGILRFDGGKINPRDLERIGNVLAHRGPDGRKSLVEGQVGLGHCLMRVNNEDVFEVQPLHDREAGLTLVADCRIDNREELATLLGLAADDVRDMPDSRFILNAYKKWGEAAPEHLLGDFAFAVWDGRAKKLVLARDHMGQRVIHYHLHDDFFIFATELKGVLSHPDVPRVLSDAAIVRRITCFYVAPTYGETFYERIFGLVGAGAMTVGADGSAFTRRYWEPHADPAHVGRGETYYVESYRRVLGEAVACRLRRLRNPPALCYGGGFDTTAIAGLAGPVLTAQRRKLIAICSVMPEDYRGPARHARRWAEICARDMPHVDMRYHVRGEATVFTGMERLFFVSDTFEGVNRFMFDAIFAQAAAAGARLVMDGHGGDFTLNPRGNRVFYHLLRSGRFAQFLAEFGPHMKASGASFWDVLRGAADAVLPLRLRRAVACVRRGFAPPIYDGPANPRLADALCAQGRLQADEATDKPKKAMSPSQNNVRVLKVVSSLATQGWAAIAATRGLDLTRPFHDKRVVELGLAIPDELLVRGGRVRYMARRALADIYPAEFRNRDRYSDLVLPDLDGMMDAAGQQLRDETDAMARDPALSRYVDFPYLKRAFERPPAGQTWTTVRRQRRLVRALAGFAVAKFVAWEQARNAPPTPD